MSNTAWFWAGFASGFCVFPLVITLLAKHMRKQRKQKRRGKGRVSK